MDDISITRDTSKTMLALTRDAGIIVKRRHWSYNYRLCPSCLQGFNLVRVFGAARRRNLVGEITSDYSSWDLPKIRQDGDIAESMFNGDFKTGAPRHLGR